LDTWEQKVDNYLKIRLVLNLLYDSHGSLI
jgi:hypothetical protein